MNSVITGSEKDLKEEKMWSIENEKCKIIEGENQGNGTIRDEKENSRII